MSIQITLLALCALFASGLCQQNVGQQSANQSEIYNFMRKLHDGALFGVKSCKQPKDCGFNMKCDALMRLCVPYDTPILAEDVKQCATDDDCSFGHRCINQGYGLVGTTGFCRFCGPKACRNNMDCCGGVSGAQFECVSLEHAAKVALQQQLGQGMPNNVYGINNNMNPNKSPEMDSEEVLMQNPNIANDPLYNGKRCWHRCFTDNDCHLNSRLPAHVRNETACCQGHCIRRESCIQTNAMMPPPQPGYFPQQQPAQVVSMTVVRQPLPATQWQPSQGPAPMGSYYYQPPTTPAPRRL